MPIKAGRPERLALAARAMYERRRHTANRYRPSADFEAIAAHINRYCSI